MTYIRFLAVFLLLPATIAAGLAWFVARRGRAGRAFWPGKSVARGLLAHVVLAVAYTAPWDNYLVATRVWWYDPARVIGLTLGWVPVEEYGFFILQTLLTGLVLFALVRRMPPQPSLGDIGAVRILTALVLAAVWLAALVTIIFGSRPGTYLGLEFAWALPPIAVQLAVGADILWRYRRPALLTLLGVTLYLCAADAVAIRAGVWSISPAQSLMVFIAGVLPIEEAVFFLLTNTLLVFGLTLALAPEARERWAYLKVRLRRRWLVADSA